jgi:molybdenum cofactor biosynthesis enzyme MoaA
MLEDIGFYTLSDKRAKGISMISPMMRGELIITDRCNFQCPYCRGVKGELSGDMALYKIMGTIDLWAESSLENIRFSGGEPTLHEALYEAVLYAKDKGVKRIAISTNGSATLKYYKNLIRAGVNDFSISLDACCSLYGSKMNGGAAGMWERSVDNIKALSKLTYVTVGMVFNEHNVSEAVEAIKFADSLGVADIRVISSAQYNEAMDFLKELPCSLVEKYPILQYRINRAVSGKNVRGMTDQDSNKCYIVLDDIATIKDSHYPCIIYLREGGKPISRGSNRLRQTRYVWHRNHNILKDDICRNNCLDVCVDFNNRCQELTRAGYAAMQPR